MTPQHRASSSLLDHALDGLDPGARLVDKLLALSLLGLSWVFLVGAGLALLAQ